MRAYALLRADLMTRRLLLLALMLKFAAGTSVIWAQSQQASKLWIVGNLMTAAGPDDPMVAGLREGLRDMGYLEGRNVRIEFRTAQGHVNQLPRLAQELVQLKADVIVVATPLAAQAVENVTRTTPIVIAAFDPLAAGLVTSLAHPDGSITGLSSMSPELNAKRLQLLKEIIPGLNRVAVVWSPAYS